MDKVQLNAFLQAQEHPAFRIACAAVGNRDDALDIVQDTMLQLARAYGGRSAEEWPPLFYRILNNRIMDHFRRHKSRTRWLLEGSDATEVSLQQISGGQCGQQTLIQEQQMDELRNALAKLPARQQQAFLLRCWEGLDTSHTAKAMNCSEGSVKTHYFRALKALRTALGDLWP